MGWANLSGSLYNLFRLSLYCRSIYFHENSGYMGFTTYTQLGHQPTTHDIHPLHRQGTDYSDCQIQLYSDSFFTLVVSHHALFIKRNQYRLPYALFPNGLLSISARIKGCCIIYEWI